MIELGVLLLVCAAVFTLIAVAAVVKVLLWVVLLPFRLLFWAVAGLLFLPFLLLKALIGGLLMLLALPFLILGALAAALVAILIPLLPLLLLFGLIWFLVRDGPEALVRG
ncbi:MAG: hypothetical protein H0U94_15465 [Acidobacteria bacterium]|jgi:hypothetical protein|nr:hypothetical protein [Acidobacteriota bacterium]